MNITHRTVLITGGTSGIGFEMAKQLLARGNTVLVTGRDAQKLAAAAQALPGLHTYVSDVSDPAAIRELHAAVSANFPALDTLVNNAGIMRNLKLAHMRSLEDVVREIDVNLSGPIRMVQQFLPHLAGRAGSWIVNVSSGLAFVPLAAAPIYSAAKAALHAYSQTLRAQLKDRVRVIELAPPGVETPLFRGEFAAEMHGQQGMDVAVLVSRALAGIEAGKLEIRPGLSNVLRVMSRVAPGFIFKQMTRMTTPKSQGNGL
jgi:uncharacterized oxidoreductase